MAVQVEEFRVSNDALDDAGELRRRIDQDGYLFFRKLEDPDQLWDLRLQLLSVCRDGGWLQAGSALADGIADVSRKCAEGDPEYLAVYNQVQKVEAFHRAGHWPVVLDVMAKLIGEPILPHPSKVARLWFPQHTLHTTPPHQDFVHFQGTYDTYTCWTPVGDCPRELGGLAVLPGSHKRRVIFDHHFALGAGGLGVDTAQFDGAWLSTDYELGDALIFHSLTLHQALPNLTPDRLRLSLDNRYQALSQPIAEHQLRPHLSRASGLTWEEVYAGWRSRDLQYYWRDLPLTVLESDTSRQEGAFEEALRLARQGNELARPLLVRVIKRAPGAAQATAAAAALRELDATRPPA